MSQRNEPKTTAMIAAQATLIFLSIIFLVPLIWMISTSLKDLKQASAFPPVWIPNPFRPDNYAEAWKYGQDQLKGVPPMLLYLRNSVLIAVLTVTGTVVSNAIVAYSFARLKWPGREVAFAITIATMMVPFPVLMVPLFALFKDFGWVGTFRPLWIPAWFAGAFNIFLLRQFFKSIPMELSEAAKIDGCSEWGIFSQVILPLSKSALAVVGLFSFMSCWNDFLGPLIYLQDQKTWTLAVGLQAFRSQAGGAPIHLQMAASTMVVLPVIILFFFTQKQFIQGIATSGLK
jgi:multiple sugar transport system permease protein